MSKNTGGSKSAPRKGGNPLLTGLLVGMIIGVAMAAGLAWWIMKSPSPFVQSDQATAKTPAPHDKTAATARPEVTGVAVAPVPGEAPASAVAADKPRFEFYKVLTDKQENVAAPEKPKPEAKPTGPHYLQAGSFANVGDAEKLKAKLAFLGIEATILKVTIPEKGEWHRVRLGPYKSAGDAENVRATLKQNGIEATPTHAQ